MLFKVAAVAALALCGAVVPRGDQSFLVPRLAGVDGLALVEPACEFDTERAAPVVCSQAERVDVCRPGRVGVSDNPIDDHVSAVSPSDALRERFHISNLDKGCRSGPSDNLDLVLNYAVSGRDDLVPRPDDLHCRDERKSWIVLRSERHPVQNRWRFSVVHYPKIYGRRGLGPETYAGQPFGVADQQEQVRTFKASVGILGNIGLPFGVRSSSESRLGGVLSFEQGEGYKNQSDKTNERRGYGGPQHTFGPVRNLPVGAQIFLGALCFTVGGLVGGKALFDLRNSQLPEANLGLFLAGIVLGMFGLMVLIGALVAL